MDKEGDLDSGALGKFFSAAELEKTYMLVDEKTGVEDSVRCVLECPSESVGRMNTSLRTMGSK